MTALRVVVAPAVTDARLIAEVRVELASGHYQGSHPAAKRTSLKEDDVPRQFKRAGTTVNRYLADLSHVFTVARKEWR